MTAGTRWTTATAPRPLRRSRRRDGGGSRASEGTDGGWSRSRRAAGEHRRRSAGQLPGEIPATGVSVCAGLIVVGRRGVRVPPDNAGVLGRGVVPRGEGPGACGPNRG